MFVRFPFSPRLVPDNGNGRGRSWNPHHVFLAVSTISDDIRADNRHFGTTQLSARSGDGR